MEPQPRGNLIVQRHYVPRAVNADRGSSPRPQPRHSTHEQRSPDSQKSALSYSPSGNGYAADNSLSEVSSMTGSVDSSAAKNHNKPEYFRDAYQIESGDSGNYSRARTISYASSMASYTSGDTDIDSVTKEPIPRSVARDESNVRYQGELYRPAPQPAPRINQKEIKQMYGEAHPKHLPAGIYPTPSSVTSEEMESASEMSVPSFDDVPQVRPRASMRKKKVSEANSAFISDEEASFASKMDKRESLPRGILKNNSTDISDAESLAKSSNFSRSGSRRSVRFEHRDKTEVAVKKAMDYSALDSDEERKKKTSKSADPFAYIPAIGIKPARNDPKRSSGGSRGSRSSNRSRKARSSSSDRSRPQTRNGSTTRSRSDSSSKTPRSSSKDRTSGKHESDKRETVPKTTNSDEVRIEMQNSDVRDKKKSQSMMGEIMLEQQAPTRNTDMQKKLKWALIIGIPLIVLAIVGAVVGYMLAKR